MEEFNLGEELLRKSKQRSYSVNGGDAEEKTSSTPLKWPDSLPEDAYYGITGGIVRKIGPHTESDPVAILAQFLTMFGTSVGKTAYYPVEASSHFCNLNMVMVGQTGKARKGTSFDRIKGIFKEVDPEFTKGRVKGGLTSGEGLIYEVRDSTVIIKAGSYKDGEYESKATGDPGAPDSQSNGMCW